MKQQIGCEKVRKFNVKRNSMMQQTWKLRVQDHSINAGLGFQPVAMDGQFVNLATIAIFCVR